MFSGGLRRVLGDATRCARAGGVLTGGVRTFTRSAPQQKTVQLDYELQEPPSTDRDVAQHTDGVVQNWRSLAKNMAKDFGVPVYTLDLRNHGSSPHAGTMSYTDMAADVKRFFSDHKLTHHTLIGHSLGGKVAMAMALDPSLPSGTLSHLVSVDMSPAEGPISPEFMVGRATDAAIEQANVKQRSEADEILQKVEPNLGVRQFLLTNLERGENGLRFRIPVQTMIDSLEGIGLFPYAPGKDGAPPERQWKGPTLFVKGAHSKYINKHNVPVCEGFFPDMELAELPTGHWVQSESPRAFLECVREFLLEH